MANVMFKRGSQYQLDNLTTYIDGAFYLTTDTDRLYVAQSSSELVELNKSIHIVSSISDLPANSATTTTAIKGAEVAEGQFYYISGGASSVGGNILAVCSKIDSVTGAISWTQINPDTNTKLVERTTKASKADDTVTVTDSLFSRTFGGVVGTDEFASDIDYTGEDGLVIAVEKKYVKVSGNEADYANGAKYYKKSDDGSYVEDTFAESNSANYSSCEYELFVENGYELTFTPPTYTLSTSAIVSGTSVVGAEIALQNASDADSTADVVNIKAGTGISVAVNGDDITISSNADSVKASTIDNLQFAAAEEGFNFTIQMANEDNYSTSDKKGDSGNTLADGVKLDPVIQLGDTAATDHQFHFANGIATLPVYTKAEVDKLKIDFNAMMYKGTISKLSDLDDVNISNGDVYMLTTGGSTLYLNDKNQIVTQDTTGAKAIETRAGDLVVASVAGDTNDEGTDGFLTSPVYSYIPSGNDVDTTYMASTDFSSSTASITIGSESADGTMNDAIGKFSVKADETYLTVTAKQNTTKDEIVTTISHKAELTAVTESAPNTNLTMAAGDTNFKISVPTISYDAAGHITKIEKAEYTLNTDSNASMATEVSVANTTIDSQPAQDASIKTSVTDSSTVDTTLHFVSETLNISTSKSDSKLAANDSIQVDLIWGDFNS